ncbi:TPA: hypothetical protein NKU90_000404 [Vibrio parahaemolyticus]|uniref:hypothetical protein n=1 Tax=Vibrio parahaemolyticus TaxID=670 RepID=UPI000762045B|nr:hypothetical protein [Vibrio parahaemolyticus]EJA7355660.1 hypothetical protein [Vibrio parahaemolyticus]KWU38730.1 hypothetical protein AVL52_02900 [Vibrio parahaemolyticus]MCZ6285976.1 hypothetical protein [Vibrio parahaemolyticus]HCE4825315.1 hypothetical protein [Vibrio parahaemolyticus]HCG8119400.1 hypothetical protein [Vibrio parahaemolyticus]
MENKNIALDEELVELCQVTLKDFINGMSLSDYERLLVLKNLTSEQENRLAVKAQGAALFAALSNIGSR